MAHDNIHFEPNLVSQYQREYLSLINYYTQLNRQSIFIKYFNINMSSTYDNTLFSTYDHYNDSNIKFDIYEYTPSFYIQPISNRSTYNEQSAGDVLQGMSSITVNTISRPRINDVIYFYSPIHSQEIFRVINITTSSNMIHSEPNVTWYELDIEYAPLEDITKLNILNHYVYDLSIEEYLPLTEYREKLNTMNSLIDILFNLKTYYNRNLDVYLTDDKYIPIDLNNIITQIKNQKDNKFKKVIQQYPTPYNYTNYIDESTFSNSYLTINQSNINNTITFPVYDLTEKELIDYPINDITNPTNDLEQVILFGYNLLTFLEN